MAHISLKDKTRNSRIFWAHPSILNHRKHVLAHIRSLLDLKTTAAQNTMMYYAAENFGMQADDL